MQLTDQQRRSNTQVGAPPQSVDLGLRRLKRLEGATQRVVRTYLHDLRHDARAGRDILRQRPHTYQ